MRVQTNILCDENLKKTALTAGISLSQTLEEALRIRLSMPKEKQGIEERIRELESQITYLKSEEFAAHKKEEEIIEKRKQAAQQDDIAVLRRCWAKKVNNEMTSDKFNSILRAFCTKYSIDLSSALSLAESKGETKQEELKK